MLDSQFDHEDPERLALGRDKRFLRDEVYRVLRRWIIEQRLAWGQELIETALADRLGVSRTPVRESIRQLEAEGLVERHASGGVRVRRFTSQDIQQIYDVILPLFELSAVLAAERYDPAVGPGLEADLAQAGGTDDIARMLALRDDFHDSILRLAHNPWLTRSLAQLREYTGPYRRALLRNEHYRRETLDQMWGIYSAIRDRQPADAGTRMRAHILDFRDKVLDAMADASTRRNGGDGVPRRAVEQRRGGSRQRRRTS
jgi:DNA-binding GntR family transcriptional regulator